MHCIPRISDCITVHVTSFPLSDAVCGSRTGPCLFGPNYRLAPNLSVVRPQLANCDRPTHDLSRQAAAIKALNAKIRSNKYTDYFCSTRTYSTLFLVGALGSGRAWEGRDK
jgi:hypothetical protein